MKRCPNCNYTLVLLEKRRRYKCAKCSKLFFQKSIELKIFKEFNQAERKKSREQYKKSTRQSYIAKKIIPKIIEELKNPMPPKSKKSDSKRKREYRINQSEQAIKKQNEKRNARRNDNLHEKRVNLRIDYWKQRQKALALQMFENELEKAYTIQKKENLAHFDTSLTTAKIVRLKKPTHALISDGHSGLVTPVPIPNTEVKLSTFVPVLSYRWESSKLSIYTLFNKIPLSKP